MKRLYSLVSLLLLCAASALIFVACSPPASSSVDEDGSSPSSQSTSSVAPASSPNATSTSETTSEDSSSQSSPPASNFQPTPQDASGEPVGEQFFTGTIEDMAMGTLFVTSEEGQTLGFQYTGDQLSGVKDYRSGAKVNVYYTGTLVGADTSGITVLRFEDAS